MTAAVKKRIRLLVSVRNLSEAKTAFSAGADVIDLKEPLHGPLGAVDQAARDSILAWARKDMAPAGTERWPDWSLAMGELLEQSENPSPETAGWAPDLETPNYIKFGLAGCSRRDDWEFLLQSKISACSKFDRDCLGTAPVVVAVAYVDFLSAAAPEPEQVLAAVIRSGGKAILLDTFCKSVDRQGRSTVTLFSELTAARLQELIAKARDRGIETALAGSLQPEHVPTLMALAPDMIGVRGAICEGGRKGSVSEIRIRALLSSLGACPNPPGSPAGSCREVNAF